MIFTHDITLDITFNKIETITLKQYTQNSHILRITLTNRGVSFPADKNLNCYFKMLTPDGKHIFTDGSIHEDGTIRVLIPETACLTAGNGKAELVLSGTVNESASDDSNEDNSSSDALNEFASDNSNENKSVFLTMEFNIHIAASVYDHAAITSSDDFSALTTALRKANETYENVMENAQKSADTSSVYAALSETYAHGQTGTREGEDTDNAMYYKTKAQEYASAAADCKTDITNTKTQIDETAETIHTLRDEASSARDEANNSSQQSKTHADLSMSYVVGTGGAIREGDTVDNAKYYKEQAERISEGLKGSLLPMGTIAFEDLPDISNDGYMYNISNEFTTTERFKEGAGHIIPAGTNVYYTADGYWDCLAGSPVTGVKGNTESSYRRGNVNITAENIGLGNVDNTADVNKKVAFAVKAAQDEDGNLIADTYTKKSDLFNLIYPIGSIYMSVHSANPGTLFGGTWVAWGTGRVPVGINGNDGDFSTVEQTGGSKSSTYTPSGTVGSHVLTTSEIPRHTHTVGAHAHGLNSHKHSIPALSGTTTLSGEHTHAVYREQIGTEGKNQNVPSTGNDKVEKTGLIKASGEHKHSFTIPANTSGAASGNTANSAAFNAGSTGGGSGHAHTFSGTAANINTVQPYITCYMWKRTA